MSIANNLDIFIKSYGDRIFIEAEAKPSRLSNFYLEYNSRYTPSVNDNTNGIIVLEEDANKWGLELRLYLNNDPGFVNVTHNRVYRKEYSFRINDKDLIWEMFELGYRIGLN